jgi:exopolyphosphatase/guanosine-5'-triphosphate,3'-diphosphate pyrophosphatase
MVKEVDLHAALVKEAGKAPDSPLAVIDIGATSMRMLVAQVDDEGQVHELEALQQSVTLGTDTFTNGTIHYQAIEDCIVGLRNFLRILREYRLAADSPYVRVVATSAVREATNRQAFLDRVFIATQLEVDVVDTAEVARFTYLGIRPFLGKRPFSVRDASLLVEVGGGGTEVLGLAGRTVLFSQAHRFGSLRVRQHAGDRQTSEAEWQSLVENQVRRIAEVVQPELPDKHSVRLVAMGGDARFAARQLDPDWLGHDNVRVATADWRELVNEIVPLTPDELVQRYHLTYPAAETLGPALLAYSLLAERLNLKWIYVTAITMRDGVLSEMAKPNMWEGEFTKQIIHSAQLLAQRYQVDLGHAEHVAKMARKLFTFLRKENGLGAHYELILTLAALLHEVGMFVSTASHHKHSQYIISNSEIFGLGRRSIELVAQVARYHRRAEPKATHDSYNALRRDERIAVSMLAAMLRIVDALERSHTQRLGRLDFERQEDALVIAAHGITDIKYEQMALAEKSGLFEQVFGLRVMLTKGNGHG